MPEYTKGSWFEESAFFKNKAAECNVLNWEGQSNWSEGMARAWFESHKIDPFENWVGSSNFENVSPNQYFDPAVYLTNKANQLIATNFGGRTDWTASEVLKNFQELGISAWDHYTTYGQLEGINPSNAFDNNAFFAAKAIVLNEWQNEDGTKGFEGRTDWTPEEVMQGFAAMGINPIMNLQENPAAAIPTLINPVAEVNVVTPPADFELWEGQAQPELPTQQLTPNDDTIPASDQAVQIEGVVSNVASKTTLNPGDKIDGGNAQDILSVTLDGGNFSGFKDPGYMKGVPTVNIENAGTNARSFSANGIEGATTFNLTGAVNLSDLGKDVKTVNMNDNAANAAKVAFAADAVSGDSDALTLGLNNVGVVASGTVKAVVNTVTLNGIEDLTISAGGANNVNIKGGNAIETVDIVGNGNLAATIEDDSVTAINAAEASGTLNLTAAKAAGLETVVLGTGDDVLNLGSDQTGVTITDAGGTGDEVVLDALNSTNAVELNMSGVETLTLKNLANSATLSGKQTSGLETIKLSNQGSSAVTIADYNDALILQFDGTTNAGNVTIADTPELTIQVGDGTGSADSSYSSTIAANAADTVNINLLADAAASSFSVEAKNATALTIDSQITDALSLSSCAFDNLETADITAQGAVTIAGLGGKSESITVNAKDVQGNFGATIAAFAGDADAEASATVTGSGLAVNTVTVEAGYDEVSFTGGLKANVLNVDVNQGATITIDFTGGVDDDTLNMSVGGTSMASDKYADSITVTGDFGLGTDTISTLFATNIDLSDLKGVDATLNGVGATGTGDNGGSLLGGDGDDILIALDARMGQSEMTSAASVTGTAMFTINWTLPKVTDGSDVTYTVSFDPFGDKDPSNDLEATITVGSTNSTADLTGTSVAKLIFDASSGFDGYSLSSAGNVLTFTHDGEGGIEGTPTLSLGDNVITAASGAYANGVISHDAVSESAGVQYIMDGGAGTDIFCVGTQAGVYAGAITGASVIINNYEAGEDISFATTAGTSMSASVSIAADKNYGSITDFTTDAMGIVGNGTYKVYAAAVGDNVFIAYGTEANKFESLVQLSGVSISDITVNDIHA